MKLLFELDPKRNVVVVARPGSTKPRFWIKRITFWESTNATEPIRDISFRAGLNIVWSPDPADRGSKRAPTSATGHGAGKSLLCRMVRYCLGENYYGDSEQRDTIIVAYPKGIVGCEFEVEGQSYVVCRSMARSTEGAFSDTLTLDELARKPFERDGHRPAVERLNALVPAACTEQLEDLLATTRKSPARAWRTVLATLTRDQQLRLTTVDGWRVDGSNSGAPICEVDPLRRLGVLLSTLGIDGRPFVQSLVEANAAKKTRRNARAAAAERRVFAKQQIEFLTGRTLPTADLMSAADVADILNGLREERRQLDADPLRVNLEKQAQASASEAATARDARSTTEGTRQTLQEQLDRDIETHRGAKNRRGNGVRSRCPECSVPLPLRHGDGCTLSSQAAEDELFANLQHNIERLKVSIAKIDEKLPALREAEHQAEKQARVFAEQFANVRDSYLQQQTELDRKIAQVAQLEAQQRSELPQVDRIEELHAAPANPPSAALRTQINSQLRDVSQHFETALRHVYADSARGRVEVHKSTLYPRVSFTGDLSTTAIDSVSIALFDLAVLWLAAEEKIPIPAFLIHDSPREGDLGLSRYDNLFRFVRKLEGDNPLFQYIITTTTSPPDDIRVKPWLVEELGVEPDGMRLLRMGV